MNMNKILYRYGSTGPDFIEPNQIMMLQSFLGAVCEATKKVFCLTAIPFGVI